MQPCICYIEKFNKCTSLIEKFNIPCKRAQFNSNAITFGNSKKGQVFFDCPNCKMCHLELGIPYRKYKSSNAIINDYGDGRTELVVYNKPFSVLEDHANLTGKVERNYKQVQTDDYGLLLVPKNETIRDADLYTSLHKCSKRAQDNYYGKALSNHWKYFATFTISPETCNRYSDKDVKSLWTLFRQKICKQYPEIQYLCVPERHADGALHFHALLNLDQDLPLQPYITKHGKQYSKTGSELYTFDAWQYGICTLAIIPPEDNQCAVINYLIAYTTKQSNLGWGQRRFFASRNLLQKTKSNYLEYNKTDIDELYDLVEYKKKDGMTIYRNFNIELDENNNLIKP